MNGRRTAPSGYRLQLKMTNPAHTMVCNGKIQYCGDESHGDSKPPSSVCSNEFSARKSKKTTKGSRKDLSIRLIVDLHLSDLR